VNQNQFENDTLAFDWEKIEQLKRGRLERRQGVSGGPSEYLTIAGITGMGGWRTAPLTVDAGVSYRFMWSTKCTGAEEFVLPEPRDAAEEEFYDFMKRTYLPFRWPWACDFVGLVIDFSDSGGNPVSTERFELDAESHANVISGRQGEDYIKYRDDMTRYWSPAWIEFMVPDKAQSVTFSILIESRAEINSGLALADFSLEKVVPSGEPKEGFSRYIIKTVDYETGKPVSARIAVKEMDGGYHVPPFSINNRFPIHYFYSFAGEALIDLPVGSYRFEAVKGFEYCAARADALYVPGGKTETIELEMVRELDMSAKKWFAGDHHIHLSGHATKDFPLLGAETGLEMGEADGFSYLPFQAGFFEYQKKGRELLRSKRGGCIGQYANEIASQVWGHYCTFGASVPFERLFAGHVLYPTMYDVVKAINERGGACVATHPSQMICQPYNTVATRRSMADGIANPGRWNCAKELPLVLLLGEPCGYDLMIADGHWGQQMATREYYRLLNFGFHVGAGGSTDTGVNSGKGYFPGVRTYVMAEELSWPAITRGMRECRSFATNGPVILVNADAHTVGDTIRVREGDRLHVDVEAFSPWGLAQVSLVYNGSIVERIPLGGEYHAKTAFDVALDKDGWLVVVVRGPDGPWVNSSMFMENVRPVFGQMAHTSPIYVRFGDRPYCASSESSEYYKLWVSNLRGIAEAHKHLLVHDAEKAALPADEVWDIIMGRIDKALAIIDRPAEENPWA